jgi:hypothetical protein
MGFSRLGIFSRAHLGIPRHGVISSPPGCMTVALTSRHGRMTPWVYVVLSARRKIWFIMIKNTMQFFHIGLALVFPLGRGKSVVYPGDGIMVKNKDLTPLPPCPDVNTGDGPWK